MIRILVVDDDVTLVTLLKKYFQMKYARDASIETAGNGKEALEKFESFQPEVVILDHMMPKMDGLHVLDEMRTKAGGKGVKVIIYSAFNLRRESTAHGADGFIQKPATVDQIQRAIDQLIARK